MPIKRMHRIFEIELLWPRNGVLRTAGQFSLALAQESYSVGVLGAQKEVRPPTHARVLSFGGQQKHTQIT